METVKKKKGLKVTLICIVFLAVIIGGFFAFLFIKYNKAVNTFNAGNYDEAKVIFTELKSFNGSEAMVLECDYAKAASLINNREYDAAKEVFATITEYKDSADMVLECDYRKASENLEKKNFDEAKALFYTISDYKDSETMISECDYQKGMSQLKGERYDEYMAVMNLVPAYKTYVFYGDWDEWDGCVNINDDAIAVATREPDHRDTPFEMYDYFETDLNDYSKEESLREFFMSLGEYSDSKKVVKDLTMIIASKKFYRLSFEEAKEEFDKYPEDEEFQFFSRVCDMEIIRDLAFNRDYDELGKRVLALENDDFLNEYYGKHSGYENEDYNLILNNKNVDLKYARHYRIDGVMHQIIYMYGTDGELVAFHYGVSDREDTNYGFLTFYADGKLAETRLWDTPSKRWED